MSSVLHMKDEEKTIFLLNGLRTTNH